MTTDEQRHRPPDDPPRARPEALQHERRDQSGRQDADPGAGIEQAEQEVRPLGPRLRDRRRQRAAADEIRPPRRGPPAAAQSSGRRNCPRWRTAPATATQASVPQRTDADQPEAPDQPRGDQRAGEIAGRIDGVHEARGGIRPAAACRACPAAPANRRNGRCRARRSAPATGSGSAARDARCAGTVGGVQGITPASGHCGRPCGVCTGARWRAMVSCQCAQRRFSTPPIRHSGARHATRLDPGHSVASQAGLPGPAARARQ